jgi:hypothetical protein
MNPGDSTAAEFDYKGSRLCASGGYYSSTLSPGMNAEHPAQAEHSVPLVPQRDLKRVDNSSGVHHKLRCKFEQGVSMLNISLKLLGVGCKTSAEQIISQVFMHSNKIHITRGHHLSNWAPTCCVW